MNRICEILGITKPVIQAPMTWITSPELVAAVSNAGGLGILGFNAGFEAGKATPEETAEEMRKVIRRTRELTDKPFGMNVMTSAFDGAGFSKATIEVCKEEGVPVLAAGGIVNEAMAKASACVGAEGAYAGTRFVLSKECRAAQATKDDVLNTGADDLIVLTEADGYLKWRCTPHKVAEEAIEENRKGNLKPSTGSFYEGMLKGDLDAGINTVSSAASLIKSIDSCEDIVNELARGYGA